YLRARDRKLVALAAHVLDQDRQVQLAAAGNAQDIRLVSIFYPQRNVALQLAVQAFTDLSAGNVLALTARERRGVDLEIHGQGGLINTDGRQARRGFRSTERQTDIDILDTGNGNNVAGDSFVNRGALQAGECQNLADFGHTAIFVTEPQGDVL